MLFRIINIPFQVALFGIVIGSIVSLLTVYFVYGVKFISEYRESFGSCFLEISSFCFSLSPLIFLFIAASIIIFLKKTLKITRYHGPADVILSAHSPSQQLDSKTGFLSTAAAFISASGGASVGQYGPLVHLGGTIGNILNRAIPGLISKDTFIGCGVAAAISAGFNSPIGGIIFAHEAILRHFSFKAIAPIAVSSVVSSTLANYFFPSSILLQCAAMTTGPRPGDDTAVVLDVTPAPPHSTRSTPHHTHQHHSSAQPCPTSTGQRNAQTHATQWERPTQVCHHIN